MRSDEERISSVDEDAEESCDRARDIGLCRSLRRRSVHEDLAEWLSESVLAEAQRGLRLDGGMLSELRELETSTESWLTAAKSKE